MSSGNIVFVANGLGGLNVLYFAISPYEKVVVPEPAPAPEDILIIGKWITADDGKKDVMGPTGWMSSDHESQGWQDYLYDKVSSYTDFIKVSRYGANNSDNQTLVMWSPPLPDYASNIFLHLKDCGEFTTRPGRTGYKNQDELFLQFAFGIPLKQPGAETNDQIDNMLIEMGMEPAYGFKGIANTGNHNGFHAYNDYDWNLIATEVTAKGGEIEFGWSFVPGRPESGPDGSFWFLRDIAATACEFVAGGVLAQGKVDKGIITINLPDDGRKYVLVIGMMNIGEYYAPQTEGNPHLLLSDVVQRW
jgi:hypothetical protein